MNEVKQHIDENAKAAYIDWLRKEGPIPEEAVRQHVSACSACKKEILELSEILDGMDQTKKAVLSKVLWLNPVFRAVAVLAGVLLVSLIIQFLRPDKTSVEMAQMDRDSSQISDPALIEDVRSDSVTKEIKPEAVIITLQDSIRYALNFEPDAGMEALISAKFRSINGNIIRKDFIPEVVRKGEQIALEFSDIPGDEIEFVLLSNRGKILKTIQSQGISEKIAWEYDPGLYYWKLIQSDELLAVGKFRLLNNTP